MLSTCQSLRVHAGQIGYTCTFVHETMTQYHTVQYSTVYTGLALVVYMYIRNFNLVKTIATIPFKTQSG